MLKLERESEFDRGCLCPLGYPAAWWREKDSNLHWNHVCQAEPQFQLALHAHPRLRGGVPKLPEEPVAEAT